MSFNLPDDQAQTYAAACYLAAYIAPECIWGATDNKLNPRELDPRRGLKISIRSNGLPIGAGLGASAALSVALAGAMVRLRQLMFADFLGGSADIATLDDLTGLNVSAAAFESDGWCPPDSVLHIINEWAFGRYS